jgi:hypothetical protein
MLTNEMQFGSGFSHLPIAYSEFLALLDKGELSTNPMVRDFILYDKDALPWLRKTFADAKANPPIPQDARDDADTYSRDLVFQLRSVVSRIERHRSHGSLDSSKLARLARPGLSRPEFERLAATAYRSRGDKAAVRRPRLAIVADMNWDIRSDNPAYTPNLARLAYVLAEACTLAGMESALFLSRGECYGPALPPSFAGSGRRLHIPAVAKNWHETISGIGYRMITDHNHFILALKAAMIAYGRKYGSGVGSRNGSGGIEFAKMQGADFVVALGTFKNDAKPDCLLGVDLTLPEMVAKVSEAFEVYTAAH